MDLVHMHKVPTALLTTWQGIQDFSSTFQDPKKNFSGPFHGPRMFKYNILTPQI